MFSGLFRSSLIIGLMMLVPLNAVVAEDCTGSHDPDCMPIPLVVQARFTLDSGSWYPLSEEIMKSAVMDTALANLTNSGFFAFNDKVAPEGILDFRISLIGPARSIKLTITLTVPDQPSFISTASMSVKDLDYQGLYQAFEKIGKTSAQRMLDKFNAYVLHEEVTDDYRDEDRRALMAMRDMGHGYRGRSYMMAYANKRLSRE
ncbi:MAG: hypothetical protein OEZ39_19500 [Gammaproteobacteria bacterium]|nr:hypothetical protein [Gammaproteobacteria bacterium]MDH5654052.1 hypothetical protein [Gammaproteobacteria bacterium]